jgi:23S rRNA (cytosine1962-C5)-methyltransferase
VPEHFSVVENGQRFELSFHEGYSVGLFLDQRENRRRLLTGHAAAGFPLFPPPQNAEPGGSRRRPQVLNTFAYTCAFSVCAARNGARVTSIDVSKKYLEWGKRNFDLNGLDSAEHDFIFGDVFEWLKRLRKKDRQFEVILLDPPTFSNSRQHGIFRAEHDYGDLVSAALPLLSSPGVLFASTNAASWPAEEFLASVRRAVSKAGRTVRNEHYVPQPPDFPVSRADPAYLKTAWFWLE